MKHKIIPSKRKKRQNIRSPGEMQNVLKDDQHIHLSHNGLEHGVDWDDWLRMGRIVDQRTIEEKRVI